MVMDGGLALLPAKSRGCRRPANGVLSAQGNRVGNGRLNNDTSEEALANGNQPKSLPPPSGWKDR